MGLHARVSFRFNGFVRPQGQDTNTGHDNQVTGVSLPTSPSRQPWFKSGPAEAVSPSHKDQEQWRAQANGAQQAPRLVHQQNDSNESPAGGRWTKVFGASRG